jgi:signal peptidase II
VFRVLEISDFMAQRISKKGLAQVLCGAVGIVILDQLTKYFITQAFALGDSRPVIPGFLNLVLVYNKGAAFGMFSGIGDGWRQILLTITIFLAVAFVVYLLVHDHFADSYSRVALGFILGGAVGNIIDRVRFGQVIDFVDVFFRQYHWPAFNVADSAICIGVAILLLLPGKKKAGERAPDQAA